jgi:hypothetical protein
MRRAMYIVPVLNPDSLEVGGTTPIHLHVSERHTKVLWSVGTRTIYRRYMRDDSVAAAYVDDGRGEAGARIGCHRSSAEPFGDQALIAALRWRSGAEATYERQIPD